MKYNTTFLRWVGGKSSSLEYIIPVIINKINNIRKDDEEKTINYYERFLGGGSVLNALLRKCAELNIHNIEFDASDININLIMAYRMIKDNYEELLEELDKYKVEDVCKEYYSNLKERFNELLKNEIYNKESVALFIVLNKLCFRGIYNTNKDGEFKSAFGGKQLIKRFYNKKLLDELHYLYNRFHVDFYVCNYVESLCWYPENRIIYEDPPYNHSYNCYDKNKFNFEEYIIDLKDNLAEGDVILSCSDLDDFRGLFNNIQEINCYDKVNRTKPNSIRREYLLYND